MKYTGYGSDLLTALAFVSGAGAGRWTNSRFFHRAWPAICVGGFGLGLARLVCGEVRNVCECVYAYLDVSLDVYFPSCFPESSLLGNTIIDTNTAYHSSYPKRRNAHVLVSKNFSYTYSYSVDTYITPTPHTPHLPTTSAFS